MTAGRASAFGRRFTRRSLVGLAGAAALAGVGAPAWGEPPPATSVDIGFPPPGKALVVFFRTWEYFAAAISYMVREGPTDIGLLGPGQYFVAVVEPGLHTFSVRAERRSDMQLIVEADEIYYVKYELETGVILYQPTLTPTDAWRFQANASSLKRHDPAAAAPKAQLPPTSP